LFFLNFIIAFITNKQATTPSNQINNEKFEKMMFEIKGIVDERVITKPPEKLYTKIQQYGDLKQNKKDKGYTVFNCKSYY
jgi:hypothetical protein